MIDASHNCPHETLVFWDNFFLWTESWQGGKTLDEEITEISQNNFYFKSFIQVLLCARLLSVVFWLFLLLTRCFHSRQEIFDVNNSYTVTWYFSGSFLMTENNWFVGFVFPVPFPKKQMSIWFRRTAVVSEDHRFVQWISGCCELEWGLLFVCESSRVC